jgi:ligand-binding sensor domain-containing protein
VKLPVIDKQDIRFIPLTVDGNSIQARIWNIAQDNLGSFGWSTGDGLYRYDGYSLRRYRNERDHSNSLSNEPIKTVYKGRTGSLSIGTTNEPGNNRILSSGGICCVYQDRSGALWIGTASAPHRVGHTLTDIAARW